MKRSGGMIRLKKLSKIKSPSDPSGCQGLHQNEVEITKS